MIEYIFKNKWNDINQLVEYLNQNNIQSFSQGFFTKVYKIDDLVLKVNCGDPDYGFMEYKTYFTSNPSIHAPICYNYKEIISNNKPHYIMLTEFLNPYPPSYTEDNSVTCLREIIRDISNGNKIIKKYKEELNDNEYEQIKGIYNFFKNFKKENYSIDICSVNLMLRGNIWVVNDPLVLLHGGE